MIIIQWKRMQPEWEKTKKKRIGVEEKGGKGQSSERIKATTVCASDRSLLLWWQVEEIEKPRLIFLIYM